MRYEIISAIKEIYTFSTSRVRRAPAFGFLTSNSRSVTIFLFYLGSRSASLPSKPPTPRLPRYLRLPPPPPVFRSILLPPLASYRGGNRLMYLQQPIPIVIPGYDLRLRRFDCQISSSFASPTR